MRVNLNTLRDRLLSAYRSMRLRLPFGQYAVPQRRLTGFRVVCSWCGTVMEEGNGTESQVSHGICQNCFKSEADKWQI